MKRNLRPEDINDVIALFDSKNSAGFDKVEPKTYKERKEILQNSGFNPFRIDVENIFKDLSSNLDFMNKNCREHSNIKPKEMDTVELIGHRKSCHQNLTLNHSVRSMFGYQYNISFNQNSGAELILPPTLIGYRERRKGLNRENMVAISNGFLCSTKNYTERYFCDVINVPCKNAANTSINKSFKGNFDIEKLVLAIEEIGPNNVPYIVSTITSQITGDQPVSIANLRAVYKIAQSYDIPVVMDCACFAENAYLIKKREAEFKDLDLRFVVQEMFRHADILTMSTNKEVMKTGSLIAFKNESLYQVRGECGLLNSLMYNHSFFKSCTGTEEKTTKRQLSFSFEEAINETRLDFCFHQVNYLVDQLKQIGVPCQQAGVNAIYVDAAKLFPHIPSNAFPGLVLACELYKVSGVRGLEVGSLMQGRSKKTKEQHPSIAEFLRISLPLEINAQKCYNYLIEAFKLILLKAQSVKGLRFTLEPNFFRQFNAEFELIDLH